MRHKAAADGGKQAANCSRAAAIKTFGERLLGPGRINDGRGRCRYGGGGGG